LLKLIAKGIETEACVTQCGCFQPPLFIFGRVFGR
jgi:hypothetical protein